MRRGHDAGEIHVSACRSDGGAVEVAIRDTGIGIAPSDLAIIFDDFRQVDGSFTRRYGGLGIGLTLARELIGLLDGELELRSEVGVGTTVYVRLPHAVAAPEMQRTRAARVMPPVSALSGSAAATAASKA